jgi:hypothetical protein
MLGRTRGQLLIRFLNGDDWMALPLGVSLLIATVGALSPSEALFMPVLWLIFALGVVYQLRSTQDWPGNKG